MDQGEAALNLVKTFVKKATGQNLSDEWYNLIMLLCSVNISAINLNINNRKEKKRKLFIS